MLLVVVSFLLSFHIPMFQPIDLRMFGHMVSVPIDGISAVLIY